LPVKKIKSYADFIPARLFMISTPSQAQAQSVPAPTDYFLAASTLPMMVDMIIQF